MSKLYKFGQIGLITGCVTNAGINLVNQFRAMNNNPELKFDWTTFFKSAGKGALIGGTVGAGLGFFKDASNSKVKKKNTDYQLYNLAGKVRLDTASPEFAQVK